MVDVLLWSAVGAAASALVGAVWTLVGVRTRVANEQKMREAFEATAEQAELMRKRRLELKQETEAFIQETFRLRRIRDDYLAVAENLPRELRDALAIHDLDLPILPEIGNPPERLPPRQRPRRKQGNR